MDRQLPPEADPEEPTVFSELAWADVQLPSPVTEQQLDELILPLLKARWRSVTHKR